MWRVRVMAVAAVVSLGVAAMPDGAMAKFGGGGGGGGGHSWGGGGGHSWGGGSFSHSFSPGGSHSFSPGFSGSRNVFRPGFSGNRNFFVKPGLKGSPGVASSLAGHHVIGGGRFAMIGGHRVHGRHIYGFIPGFGYGYYWYYDDCWVWTDYGWINMCGYGLPLPY